MRILNICKIVLIVSCVSGFMLMLSASNSEKAIKDPVDYVDPFIGSGGHGHVFVGANVPFGAVQIGPNNIYKGLIVVNSSTVTRFNFIVA